MVVLLPGGECQVVNFFSVRCGSRYWGVVLEFFVVAATRPVSVPGVTLAARQPPAGAGHLISRLRSTAGSFVSAPPGGCGSMHPNTRLGIEPGVPVTGSLRRHPSTGGQEAMIDTQESDLTPAVAATIGPLHTTRRGLVHPGMFAEIETGTSSPSPAISAHIPRPELSPARNEKRKVSPHDRPPHRKNVTTRVATCRGSATKISHSPVLAAPLVATKISTTLRTSCAGSVQEILPSRPRLFDQRQGCDDDPEQ